MRLRELKKIVELHEQQIRDMDRKRNFDSNCFVICETCGCVVFKNTAIRGEPKARTNIIEMNPNIGRLENEYYVHYPYYCKGCAKKKRIE